MSKALSNLLSFAAGLALGVVAVILTSLVPHPFTRPVEEGIEESSEYPTVSISRIASGKWARPRAEITGTVTLVRKEADGDIHFRLNDGKNFVVCEVVPELPLDHPTLNSTITVRGIVRYDLEHKWAEIHPVVSWHTNP